MQRINGFIKNKRRIFYLLLVIAIGISSTSCGDDEPNDDSKFKADVSGSVGGHNYIDLGLPSGTLWATCNVGADNPHEFGEYYAWGEIEPKSSYTAATCKTWGKDIPTIIGDPALDAATANWGHNWVTPTTEQWIELVQNCEMSYILDSESGVYFKGPNGKMIFFPNSGCMIGETHRDSDIYLWASDQFVSSEGVYNTTMAFSAWCEFFGDKATFIAGTGTERYPGGSVRAVVK